MLPTPLRSEADLQRYARDKKTMWYDKLGVISIGCQCGGPRDNGIGTIKIDLWRLLCEHCTSTHCAGVDHYALALRIGGTFVDCWTPEQIHRVRRNRKNRFISCDIDIPMAVWQSKSTDQLKHYLAAKVREAIEILVMRLQADKETVDTDILFGEIDQAIGHFRQTRYEDMA